MNDYGEERIDRMFKDDVREKKMIANQARYRKRGSRSKKCTLSTDRMTHKQWLERCGETVTYNFNKPIAWQEFCKLPIHIQKEYLLNLIQQYSTTASDLAKMFGITPQTVTKHCSADEIGIRFTPGKRMTKENRQAFDVFCGVVEHKEKCEPVAVKKAVADTTAAEVCAKIEDAVPSKDMAMTEFTLSFAGNFSRDMLCNSLLAMLPKGVPVKMDVKCSIML